MALLNQTLLAVIWVTAADVETRVSFDLDHVPNQYANESFVPTPVDIVAGHNETRAVYRGFGSGIRNMYPWYSVVVESFNANLDASERNQQAADDFSSYYNINTDAANTEQVVQRRERWMQLDASERLEDHDVFDRDLEINVLHGRTQNFALQLGGWMVFDLPVHDNYRKEYIYDSRNLQNGKYPLHVNVVKLEAFPNNADALRYRFYRGMRAANHELALPTEYVDRSTNYFERIGRYQSRGSWRNGLQARGGNSGTTSGFVFSTCVEFQELEEESGIQFDVESQCWVYDKSIAGRLLPLVGESLTEYTIEKEVVRGNNTELTRWAGLRRDQGFADLSAATSWQQP